MNTKVKIALAVIAGGTLLLAGVKRKKREKLKKFTAPDGNSYLENQIYRTFDNVLYKNGKKIRFNTLETQSLTDSPTFHAEQNKINTSVNNQNFTKDVNYHHRGKRHQ